MNEKEEKLQKLYLEFQVLDQQIKHLEKQNTALNNQLMELMATNQSQLISPLSPTTLGITASQARCLCGFHRPHDFISQLRLFFTYFYPICAYIG
ncbi:hypothetical protein IIC44_01665, partial [Patescibacteria group bacterium]|nr:hypothetical protein [Patescibacteria group bacterium]